MTPGDPTGGDRSFDAGLARRSDPAARSHAPESASILGHDGPTPPPEADCVLSSRIRLARNLLGFSFVNRADPQMLADVVHRVQATRLGGPFSEGARWVN
jgi:hypothetical protein